MWTENNTELYLWKLGYDLAGGFAWKFSHTSWKSSCVFAYTRAFMTALSSWRWSLWIPFLAFKIHLHACCRMWNMQRKSRDVTARAFLSGSELSLINECGSPCHWRRTDQELPWPYQTLLNIRIHIVTISCTFKACKVRQLVTTFTVFSYSRKWMVMIRRGSPAKDLCVWAH